MPTLHMDVEAIRSVQKQIVTNQSEMENLLTAINSSVETINQGAWMGNSAKQFFQMYEGWKSPMNHLLQTLQQMGTRLDSEVRQWEDTAREL